MGLNGGKPPLRIPPGDDGQFEEFITVRVMVRGSSPAAVQPMWDGLTIEDVYTRSAHGEIGFVIVAMADFSVTQPSAYVWQKANLS